MRVGGKTLAARTETELETGGWETPARRRVPALTVLYHPDPRRVGERITLPALSSGREVLLSRLEPAFSAPGASEKRPLDHVRLSRRPLRLLPGAEPGAIRLRSDQTPTSVIADGQEVTAQVELSSAQLETGVVLLLARHVVLLLHDTDPLAGLDLPSYELVGHSDGIARVREDIRQVADLEVPVLLRGESGTGKELVARAIHQAGPRAGRPYVTVNMAAIPPSLAAAEFFGAAKGAFTGADRHRKGYFRRAEGGTLFLDEIGETPQELQVLLLRCLESHEVHPVGADRSERIDVRLITATDLDLEAAVAEARFRAPLLYRLSGYEIAIPPVRRRRDDFGRLFFHFMRQELERVGQTWRLDPPQPKRRPWLPAPLVAGLGAYDWPGNVRQIRNVARQLVIASRSSDEVRLRPSIERLLDPGITPASDTSEAADTSERHGRDRRPADIPEHELIEVLRCHRWQVQGTARYLGISRAALYQLMDRSPRVRKASELTRTEIETCQKRCGSDLHAMVEALEVSRQALRRRMKQLGLD